MDVLLEPAAIERPKENIRRLTREADTLLNPGDAYFANVPLRSEIHRLISAPSQPEENQIFERLVLSSERSRPSAQLPMAAQQRERQTLRQEKSSSFQKKGSRVNSRI